MPASEPLPPPDAARARVRRLIQRLARRIRERRLAPSVGAGSPRPPAGPPPGEPLALLRLRMAGRGALRRPRPRPAHEPGRTRGRG